MCPRMWAHWLANMIELVLPSAHPSPQPKRQIDRFSNFCTAHCKKSLYFTVGKPFPKIATSHGRSEPPSNSWFLEPFWDDNPTSTMIDLAVYVQVTAACPYTLLWAPLSPKLPLPMGGSGPHPTDDSLGPSEPTTQTASRLVLLFLYR